MLYTIKNFFKLSNTGQTVDKSTFIEGGFELTKATQLASRNMFSSNYEIANKIIEINPSFEISERVMNNSSIELSQPFYSMSPIIFK